MCRSMNRLSILVSMQFFANYRITLTAHIAPNNIDRSLNEDADDKIRKYRADYNNNPPNTVSFMPGIVSTSGRLHSAFVRLLFLQDHRETDHSFRSSACTT